MGRIIWDWKTLGAELEKVRAGKAVVFTNGCFDLLHPGHIHSLRSARAEGDLLVVGLNGDESVRALKGLRRPILRLHARAELLAALAAVDYVTVFDEDTPAALIEAVQPDVLVKGTDYELDQIVGADIVQARGGTIKRIPVSEGWSTSALLEDIVHRYTHPTDDEPTPPHGIRPPE